MILGKTNGEYRDRLFKFIFGNPENKKWTLELYNAVNGSNYENADDIRYNTIDDAIYMNMKNDVSFIIEDTMSLYEQQATYCPNMPLRFLMYLAKLYEKYVKTENLYLYGKTLKKIPQPKCVCFYNGTDKKEDRKILRLSDMYFENTKIKDKIEGIVELEVIMINVNFGHNKKLLEKCKPLYEYSFFVGRMIFHIDRIKEERGEYVLEESIDRAIEDLPKDFKILKFILANRTEVKDMCLFEYDQEQAMKSEREEGRIEGRAEGREEGREEERENTIKMMLNMVKDKILTIEEVAKRLGMDVEELREKLNNL